MIPITILQSRDGSRVSVTFDPGNLDRLARASEIDAYIVATEDGFSPLRRTTGRTTGSGVIVTPLW